MAIGQIGANIHRKVLENRIDVEPGESEKKIKSELTAGELENTAEEAEIGKAV